MTIIQKVVKARDLPIAWRKEFPDPEAPVQVLLRLVREHGAGKVDTPNDDIGHLMDRASEQARERGLTPEILEEILDER